MGYLLGHDVGTSGDKAVLMTEAGEVVASAYETYPTRYPRPLWAEQDPEDWWRAVGVTTQRVLQDAQARPEDILGLAFSTQMTNVLALDARGDPIGPCINWLDGRAGDEARQLMRRLGGQKIFAAIVGAAMTGKDVLPKMVWLRRNAPEVYARAAALVDVSSYLLLRATGRLVAEWSVASGTGLFNLQKKTWDDLLIRFFGLDRSKFPDLVRSAERVGGLTGESAGHLGLREGTPVFGGAGDVMTAAIGSGAVGEKEAHLCLGTSGFIGIVTSRRVTGKRGIPTIQSGDPAKLLLIAETETSGECLKWAAQHLYGVEPDGQAFARMDADVASTAPGAGGLLFTPWMYGERTPVADERIRAAFINLGANHTRAHMTRAVYEGVAFNLRWMLELMGDLYSFRPQVLRVIGGGARGLPWVQIVSDVTTRRLEVVQHAQQATAIGAALLAAVGLGIVPSVEAVKGLVHVSHEVSPNPEHAACYEPLYRAFKGLYPALKDTYHALNASDTASAN
jgi:xylulokinase